MIANARGVMQAVRIIGAVFVTEPAGIGAAGGVARFDGAGRRRRQIAVVGADAVGVGIA